MRGLFAGGTLCAEAQIVFGRPVFGGLQRAQPGAAPMRGEWSAERGHLMIDLGADEFTRGRPHPMIDPAVRDEPLAKRSPTPRSA